MALPANIGSLIEELITVTAGVADKNAPRFKILKDRAAKTFKQNNSGRVDQFQVAKKLDGLQEKFRVLNNDGLADALRLRLDELDAQRNSWTPEMLSLLIELSDKPATRSDAKDVDWYKPVEAKPSLTWSDFHDPDSLYGADDIWEDIDYAAETSDEDISLASSDVSIPRILPQSSKVVHEDYVIPDTFFSTPEGENLVSLISNAQFWRGEPESPSSEANPDHGIFVTELQVIRETLFMLQGLPTSIFWRLDGTIEVDRRFALRHSSNQSFLGLLQSFSSVGARIDTLRSFTKSAQPIQFVQTFQKEIEDLLSDFDTFLSNIQSRYSAPSQAAPVSLMGLSEDVAGNSRLLLQFSSLLGKVDSVDQTNYFQFLDSLYDMTCLNQAAGNEPQFISSAKIFFKCFETYMKPIRLWMEKGQMDETYGAFFVSNNRGTSDLRSLWHDWYSLNEVSGTLHAPKFLRPVAREIFTTGKSMVFLQHLNTLPEQLEPMANSSMSYEDVCQSDSPSLLLPFSGLLETALSQLVKSNHSIASKFLRKQLDEECGLWISLEALEFIHLGKDGTISNAIDGRVFELIDRRKATWNDRFLLTELVQDAFSSLSCVDPTRILVRSTSGPYRDTENLGRSVKILSSLSIEYALPWPVANIITDEARPLYRRISTFLMQIRRGKYVVERQRLANNSYSYTNGDNQEDMLGYRVRYSLLWFVNLLYSHLTEQVIAISTAEMQRDLSKAKSIDAMVAVHSAYATSLESQCLLSKSLAPIHQAIISLLDLCINFADTQATRHGENKFDVTTRSMGSSVGQQRQPHRRKSRRRLRRHEDSESEEHSSEDEEDSSFMDEGNTSMVSFIEFPYASRLRNLNDQFHRLCAFITSGLKGVGRIDGQQSWEILAEKLEWKSRDKSGRV
ncbi:hypothetical protein FQN54_009777 [Arachnomyces sp. PD_36]|nr:hypothetical protein FQN54_009777 [Arachnomyces sp. PD_36]